MTIADYDEVYKLWKNCSGMGLNNLDDSKDGIARFLHRNPNTCFVAQDKSIIGVIMAGHDGRRGFIYHTSVSPLHRHKGIATQLVKQAISSLKAEGINKVALVVFEKNIAGNTFWEKQGFTAREDLVYRNLALTDIIRIDS